MKYPCLLFDADDTLFDFPRAEADALQWTLEQSGVTYQPGYAGLYSKFNQQVWREFERGETTSLELREKRFRLFFDELGLVGDLPAVSRLYLHNLALGTTLLDDADAVVHNLKANHTLALVTNGLKDVQRPRLERSSLRDCFEYVFISEELGAAKPAREFFEAVFTTMGKPDRAGVLMIGDSLTSDMQGGIDYGIDTCWYNPRGKPTDLPVTYQIRHLKELIDLV